MRSVQLSLLLTFLALVLLSATTNAMPVPKPSTAARNIVGAFAERDSIAQWTERAFATIGYERCGVKGRCA